MQNCAVHLARRRRLVVVATISLLLSLVAPLQGAAIDEQVFVPIGGDYTEASLQGFARVVIEHAGTDDDTVDLVVVPSTYGTSLEDREENIELAQERTDQVETACDAVVVEYAGLSDCEAELLMLFDRDQALDPANSAAIEDPATDGVFILGGDQTIAIAVLADTPAEDAMAAAYERGVVFGGTSAGAALQSRTMLAGYTDSGWPYNALEKDQIIIWWGDDGDHERGLRFGSDDLIIDQHFYQRGRITRTLNTVAQSDARFGGDSLLGLGTDYRTGVSVTNDATISDVFGDSSVMVVDGETLGASFAFTGERQTLSARNVLTHVLAPDSAVGYNIEARQPTLNGAPVTPDLSAGWDAHTLAYAGQATLILGGDVSFDWSGEAMAAFVERAQASGLERILVVVAGYQGVEAAGAAGDEYSAGLAEAGWSGTVETVVAESAHPRDFNPSIVRDAAGVLFVGGNQANLPEGRAGGLLRAVVNRAVTSAPVVLTDQAMTAAMGDWYVSNPDPTDDNYQEESIAAFQAGYVEIEEGFGIVGGAFEPRNTWDQRWGRLYAIAREHPDTIAFGISEMTAIVLEPGAAPLVTGERSVVALDGREATALTGSNGAFSLLNGVLDVFAPGDVVASAR